MSIERPEINQTEEIQLKIPICIKNLGFQISLIWWLNQEQICPLKITVI